MNCKVCENKIEILIKDPEDSKYNYIKKIQICLSCMEKAFSLIKCGAFYVDTSLLDNTQCGICKKDTINGVNNAAYYRLNDKVIFKCYSHRNSEYCTFCHLYCLRSDVITTVNCDYFICKPCIE